MTATLEGSAPRIGPGQLIKNIVFSAGSLVAGLVASLLLVPFLIGRLGVAGYGLVPVINGIASYLSVATIALTVALRRHLSVAIARRDFERATILFSTSLWGAVAAALALGLAGVAIAFNIHHFINVPVGMGLDARVLFLTGTGGVIATMLSVPISTPVFCANRLDVKGLIDVASRATYVAIAVLAIAAVAPRPLFVGVAMFVSATVGLAGSALAWRRIMPWLRIRRVFSVPDFTDMVRVGGWTLAAYAGNLLFQTVDLVLVNRLIGATEAGIYAAIMQWPNVVRQFGTVVAVALGQPTAHIFGADGTSALFEYTMRSVRLLSWLVVVLVVVVGGSAEPIVRLWLGAALASHWPLLVLLVLTLSMTMSAVPFVSALQAMLTVELIGAATLMASTVGVGLAVALAKTTGYGIYGVALAGIVSYGALAGVLIPLHAARAMGRSARLVMQPLLKALILAALGCALGHHVSVRLVIEGWFGLVAFAAALGALTAAAGFFVLMRKEDREVGLEMVRRYLPTGVLR